MYRKRSLIVVDPCPGLTFLSPKFVNLLLNPETGVTDSQRVDSALEIETGFVSACCLPVLKSCPWLLLRQDGEFIWTVSAFQKFADLKSGKSMTPSSKPKYWGGKSDILNRLLVTSIPSYRLPTCPHGLHIIHSQHVLHYLTLYLYHLSICNLPLPSIFSISSLHLSIPLLTF
jgi:hypothetical protein